VTARQAVWHVGRRKGAARFPQPVIAVIGVSLGLCAGMIALTWRHSAAVGVAGALAAWGAAALGAESLRRAWAARPASSAVGRMLTAVGGALLGGLAVISAVMATR